MANEQLRLRGGVETRRHKIDSPLGNWLLILEKLQLMTPARKAATGLDALTTVKRLVTRRNANKLSNVSGSYPKMNVSTDGIIEKVRNEHITDLFSLNLF